MTAGTLFPQLNGYGLTAESLSPLAVTYHTFRVAGPSASAPARAEASDLAKAGNRLLFPNLSEDLLAAMVVFAPMAADPIKLRFTARDRQGNLAGSTEIQLQPGGPIAFLVNNLFPNLPETASVSVEAKVGEKLTGSLFLFGRQGHPATLEAARL